MNWKYTHVYSIRRS